MGFVTFSTIIIFFIKETLLFGFKKNKTDEQKMAIILLGGLAATLANAIFIDVFEASKTAYLFWIMMGLYYQLINQFHDQK
ncbi:hypothetical protein SDC9_98615 [bioreactor metagenome]|uniref:Uncharacterized protein n=1 Tax=bioreactor metagenome TaxID=1076179 RepID=A0A645AQI8_9ZZZZ